MEVAVDERRRHEPAFRVELVRTVDDERFADSRPSVALREKVDRLAQPPSGYGVFLCRFGDETVDVFTSGRRMRVAVSPAVDSNPLLSGQTVVLNEALTLLERIVSDGGSAPLLTAIADGTVGIMKRPADRGKGLDGVAAHEEDYFNPVTLALEGTP